MRSSFAILAVEVCRMVRIYAVVSLPLRNIILFTSCCCKRLRPLAASYKHLHLHLAAFYSRIST